MRREFIFPVALLLTFFSVVEAPCQMAEEKKAEAKNETFKWTFEKNGEDPTTQPVRPASSDEDKIKKLYQELVKNNMALEAQLEKAFAEKEASEKKRAAAEKEKERLEAEIKRAGSRSEDLSKRLKALQKSIAASSGDAARLAQFERELKSVRREKEALASELSRLRTQKAGTGVGSADGVQSDYVIKLKKEKADLLRKLSLLREQYLKEKNERTDLDAKEDQLVKRYKVALEEKEALGKLVKKVLANLEEQKDNSAELASQAELFENRVEKLKMAVESKDERLAALERELKARNRELNEAEQKIVQYKQQQSDGPLDSSERRDYHYNLAYIYAEKGMHREAEKEYLRAIKADPSDPATHYNLAILYDDVLKSKRKAAKHYRRYLQLRPQAKDADIVRNWLMDIEIAEGLN